MLPVKWVLLEEGIGRAMRKLPFVLLGSGCSRAGGEQNLPLNHSCASALGSVTPRLAGIDLPAGLVVSEGGYLVDPASSHMLVSKIKPCMSKYKLLIL
jgi:hypothetical protein